MFLADEIYSLKTNKYEKNDTTKLGQSSLKLLFVVGFSSLSLKGAE